MKLTDKQALFFLIAIAIGSFIDIPLSKNPDISVNVGGGILPIVLAVYLLVKAGTTKEWVRGIVSAVITGAVIWGIRRFLNFDPGGFFLDIQYVEAIVAGIIAYLAGRSRRSAFIAGTLGILLVDLAALAESLSYGGRTKMTIGGAGALDAIIIAGFIAVLLAEIVGETRERLQGGPSDNREFPDDLQLHQTEVEENNDYQSVQRGNENEE
jgi:uncharacterized membrane protein